MTKRYFKFIEKEAKKDELPGILSGKDGLDVMVKHMEIAGYECEEVTAKQATRIRQQQNQKERLALKMQRALEE